MESNSRALLAFVAVFALILIQCHSSTLRVSLNSDSSPSLDWWQRTVVYQIYPRSFMDTDGDGVGDIKGITGKLDYFEDIGVETIWLSPIFPSPMKDFGYDISDFEAIEPMFGTMADFEELLEKAHNKGIKVVLDFVPNHTSDKHEWFEKSRNRIDPYTDYYVWKDGIGENKTEPPNNWLSMFRYSAWKFDEVRKQFYLHQFLTEQPDLNFRSPELRKEIENVIRFWLDKGVDGYRVDAAKWLFEDERFLDEPPSNNPNAKPEEYDFLLHIYTEFQPENFGVIRDWQKIIDSYKETTGIHRIFMLEVYGTSEAVATYFGNSTHPLCDFPFNFEIILNLRKSSTGHDMDYILHKWLNVLPEGRWSNWVLGNHDQIRVGTRIRKELIDGLNMITLLLPGTAITYYGEEIGMVNGPIKWEEAQDPQGIIAGKDKFDATTRDPQRTPMQWNSSKNAGFSTAEKTWLPVHPNYTLLNVKNQLEADRSHLKVYKKLVELRKEPTLQFGSLEFPVVTDSLFSFIRLLKDNPAYMVIVNLSKEDQTVDLSSAQTSGYHFPQEAIVAAVSINIPQESPAVEKATVSLENLVLGPYEAIVIKFDPIY